MLRRHSVAALAVTLAAFALTGCAAEDTLSSLNQNVDATAPAAPGNVRTVPMGGSILLDWDPSSDADVVGYDVFRYDPDPARESAYVKVNASTVTESAYTITDPSEQGTWYRVKSVDMSSNRSNASGAAYAANGVTEYGAPADGNEPGVHRGVNR